MYIYIVYISIYAVVITTIYYCKTKITIPYRKYEAYVNPDTDIYGHTTRVRAGRLINPTRVKYFSRGNYSADFSETRGIDWNLFRAPNDIPRICGSDGNIPN